MRNETKLDKDSVLMRLNSLEESSKQMQRMQSTTNQMQARIDTLENQNEDLRKLLSHSQAVTTEQFFHPASPLAIRDQRKAALDELAHEGIEAAKKEAAKSALNSAPHYPLETRVS